MSESRDFAVNRFIVLRARCKFVTVEENVEATLAEAQAYAIGWLAIFGCIADKDLVAGAHFIPHRLRTGKQGSPSPPLSPPQGALNFPLSML